MPTEAILAWFKELRGIKLGRRGPEFSPGSLQTLIDNLPIAVSMTAGREHRFVYANNLYRRILLPHAGDPVGRTVAEVFGSLYTAEFAALRDRILETGEASALREVPIHFGESAPLMYWDVSQIPMLDNSGAAQGVLTLGIEVTEKVLARREAERQAAQAMARAEEARQALAAKEILLGEVNHRVKNSLALVSSMLALQSRSIQDEALRRQMEDAHARIRTVALVHERLYTSAPSDSVQLDSYLKELCTELQRTGVDGGLKIEVAAEPVRLSNDRAVPVALVLNELVTNALKYAYGGGGGTVWVELKQDSPGLMCLTVRDEGVGLPPDFEARRAASLGFRIIDGLARQLGGRFEARGPSVGAEFALIFRAE